MVLVQKWAFSQLFFLSNIGQEKFFYDILDRTNAFLGYKKKRSSKSSKIVIFPTHGYGAKMANFCNFSFLGNMELWNRENVFYDVLDRKNAFLGYKNKKFNKSKN